MSAFETGNKLTVGPNGEPLTKTSITTWSGHVVDMANPAPKDIWLDDIARGLSQQVRWAGQGDEWFSVAQHSIEVLRVVERGGHDIGILQGALMHDASEGYFSDMIGGLKLLLADSYLPELMYMMDRAIEEAIGFQLRGFPDAERIIKEAENTLVQPEFDMLFKGKPHSEVGLEPPMCREMAMSMFVSEAERLGLKRGGQ